MGTFGTPLFCTLPAIGLPANWANATTMAAMYTPHINKFWRECSVYSYSPAEIPGIQVA